MYSGYDAFARKSTVATMSQGNSEYQTLLEGLSGKELKALRYHTDLMERIKVIANITILQALAELKEKHGLEIDQCQNQDVWVSTEKLESGLPDWFHSDHCGWFLSIGDGEFLRWAKVFLMQEVRVNIWMRYLEHKKNPKIKQQYGMYL